MAGGKSILDQLNQKRKDITGSGSTPLYTAYSSSSSGKRPSSGDSNNASFGKQPSTSSTRSSYGAESFGGGGSRRENRSSDGHSYRSGYNSSQSYDKQPYDKYDNNRPSDRTRYDRSERPERSERYSYNSPFAESSSRGGDMYAQKSQKSFGRPPKFIIRRLNVNKEDDGLRLDRWLMRHFIDVSRGELAKLVERNSVRVNNERAQIDTRVYEGDEISLPQKISSSRYGYDAASREERLASLVNTPKYQLLSDNIKNWVTYKDNDIIVLNKPVGVAVQGGPGIDISISDLLSSLQFEYDTPPMMVHRLDKLVSGALILARTRSVAKMLGDALRARRVKKEYLAILHGALDQPTGRWDFPLSKIERGSRREFVDRDDEHGKEAITEYEVLDSNGDFSLVKISLPTGRTHQIRVHSLLAGHPIFGDRKYAMKDSEISEEALSDLINTITDDADEMENDAIGENCEITIELDDTPSDHPRAATKHETSKYMRHSSHKPTSSNINLHAWRVCPKIDGKELDITVPLPPHFEQSINDCHLNMGVIKKLLSTLNCVKA